jgi:putative PIN family toxin of toxin-antitoxin system
MTIKEQIIQELDRVPESQLETVLFFLCSLETASNSYPFTHEHLNKADAIIQNCFDIAASKPKRSATEIWADFEWTRAKIAQEVLQELVAKLLYLKVRDRTIEDLVVIIAEISLHISGAYEATKLDKIDPDDNKFLAAIYESKADYLISLDNHLLSLKYYHGTQILTPHLFLTALSSLS